MFISKEHNLLIITSLCLSIAILLTLGYGITQWYQDWQPNQQITHQQLTNNAHEKELDFNTLPQAHLFGYAPTESIPISHLQLKLTGIVAANNKNKPESKAYISIQGQASKIVYQGDKLPYGVTIYAIKKDAVILSKNGELEKLPLPRQPLVFKPRNTEAIS